MPSVYERPNRGRGVAAFSGHRDRAVVGHEFRRPIARGESVQSNPKWRSIMSSESIAATGGTRESAAASSANEVGAIGLPPRAALTVAGLSRASRARSVADQPRLVISWRNRPA